MNIALNIFTNCTSTAPNTDTIRRTYDSFCDCFGGEFPVVVWIDPHPVVNKCEKYAENLLKMFDNIKKRQSLSDTYKSSIEYNDSDYLFQLEHDWQFNKNLINHSLSELTEIMSQNNIYHLRFNKRANLKAGWDTQFKENEFSGVKFCVSNNISNNPHIIDRKRYLKDHINHIKILPGSKGIEEELNATGKYYSAVYGPLNYPATVTHTDGRKLDKRVRFKV